MNEGVIQSLTDIGFGQFRGPTHLQQLQFGGNEQLLEIL